MAKLIDFKRGIDVAKIVAFTKLFLSSMTECWKNSLL